MNSSNYEQPIVAIDIEATGLQHGYHEITEIAMIRLDNKFNIIPGAYKNVLIQIDYPERYLPETQELTGIYIDDLELFGLSKYDARKEIINWIESMTDASIVPLGQFYDGYDRNFLKDFFNFDCTEHDDIFSNYVSRTSIDLKHIVKTYNNLIDYNYPDKLNLKFEKFSLGDICKKLNIRQTNKHRALDDAKVTALAYKEMLQRIVNLPNNYIVHTI